MCSLRLLLVDDHEPIRRGIRELLASHANWSVCGEAADGIDAIEKKQATVTRHRSNGHFHAAHEWVGGDAKHFARVS